MTHRSPLLDLHQQSGAVFRTYGPEGSDILVPEAFEDGGVAVEYAAIRKQGGMGGAGLLDQPQRGTLEITGSIKDRHEFLGRMVTQELKGFEPFSARRSFWLNRKGRIDADMRLIEVGEAGAKPGRMLIDLDAFAAERAVSTLTPFLFAEDIQIADRTADYHRLALHGPAACSQLGLSSTPVAGPSVLDLQPGQATVVSVAGAEVVVDRWDSAGVPGLELTVVAADVAAVWLQLTSMGGTGGLSARGEPQPVDARERAATAPRARPIGWHAYNIARIETGTALYYLDFGPDSLPHESGAETLADRVSFKKGCYLGQEVVARMQSLGHPKQRVVGVRLAPMTGIDGQPTQPETGAQLHAAADPASPVVGAVTSSTLSPMLSQTPIAFAMVKWTNSSAGSEVFLHAPGTSGPVRGEVRESLRFVG